MGPTRRMQAAALFRFVAPLLAALAFAAPEAAFACSPLPGYYRPSSFELVEEADAIVVARVTGRPARFVVERTIKGQAPDRIVTEPMLRRGQAPSDPDAVGVAHPSSFDGGCTRYNFRPDGVYLLFLERARDTGGMRVATYPFTPVAEDYYGPTSPWARTIDAYLKIQTSGPPATWIPAMRQRLEGVLRQPASKARNSEALDILRHIVNLSPRKQTPFLVEAFRAADEGRIPPYTLPEGDMRVERAYASLGKTPLSPENAAGYRRAALEALATPGHADAAPVFDDLLARPTLSNPDLADAVTFLARNGQYARAYGLIETRVLAALLRADDRDARLLLDAVATVQSDVDGEGGVARWNSDPHARETWPRLALDLRRHELLRFGDVDRALYMPPSPAFDYRAEPELALAVAERYEDAPLIWAEAELKDPARRADWAKRDTDPDDDPARLPIELAVVSSGERRDALVEALVCQGGERRSLLVQSFGRHGDSLDEDWLTRIALTPWPEEKISTETAADRRRELAQAAVLLHARRTRRETGWAPWGDIDWLIAIVSDDRAALVKAGQLGQPRMEPIRCPAN